MIKPPYLNKGDKIVLLSTARKITERELSLSVQMFKNWGLEVVFTPHLFKKNHQFAGTDKQRLSDLQWAMDNPEIKAIICARGGYGTTRFLDDVDFSTFVKNPKWLCGFSDVTALLCSINALGVEALHSTMPIFFDGESSEKSVQTLHDALFGLPLQYESALHHLNIEGNANAEIIGGNLSILINTIGTSSDFDWSGKILFLEDLDEYLYHIDRMMVHLKRAGKLKNLAGVIVGSMSDMKDNKVPFGKDAYEIIHEHCSPHGYPMAFGFPVGHEGENYAIYCGRKVNFQVNSNGSILNFER